MINDGFMLFGENKGCFLQVFVWSFMNYFSVNEEVFFVILFVDDKLFQGEVKSFQKVICVMI